MKGRNALAWLHKCLAGTIALFTFLMFVLGVAIVGFSAMKLHSIVLIVLFVFLMSALIAETITLFKKM